jgi:hypothetical protein
LIASENADPFCHNLLDFQSALVQINQQIGYLLGNGAGEGREERKIG